MKASFIVRGIPVVLALCLVGAVASIATAQPDSHVGTWKLNLAKSRFSPGPAPKSQTFTYEAADGPALNLVVQGVDAEGKPINPDKNNLKLTMDGKDYPTPTPNPDYETGAYKRTSADSWEFTRKKAGKVVQTGTNVLSKDRKTLTLTTKGTNAKGETVNTVAVYDKQ